MISDSRNWDALTPYWQYVAQRCALMPSAQADLARDAQQTDWEDPKTALDFNNFAVLLLIEAEHMQDTALRSMNLEIAIEALSRGVALGTHPLCAAHLALIHYMTGDLSSASRLAFSKLIETIHPASIAAQRLPLGLVYLPTDQGCWTALHQDELQHLLQSADGYAQAQLLLTLSLYRSQLVFYNANGLRFLQFAAQLAPTSFALHLKLGLSKLTNQQWEGVWHLQQAHQLAPDHPAILQALHLVYRGQEPQVSQFWRAAAAQRCRADGTAQQWRWTELDEDSPFTYLPFEDNLLLAAEPSFRSMVTSVLLAEGDWFEAEMQFWRDRIQPGMTVIDVGANVGIYTFSAAQRVGASGRVFAVEPFSACVRYLEESRRINQMPWVEIYAGAASDRSGKARLGLHPFSELNEVLADETAIASGESEEIDCFCLDQLVEQAGLTRVDWLKIDAENHEVQVLAGSDRLLTELRPQILYENVAGTKGSNPKIAELLRSKGYDLFRYQPYLQMLIPVESTEDLQESLNVIALPSEAIE